MLGKASVIAGSVRTCTAFSPHLRFRVQPLRCAATKPANAENKTLENTVPSENSPKAGVEETSKEKKTQAEMDDELREKLEGISGDGGAAGIELEDGQPVSMKRSVKNNMFRYI